MKKFISMVMAAAMVVSLVPATAFAANEASFKVVKDLEVSKTVAEGYEKDGMPATPELQIKLKDVDSKVGTNESFDIKLHLNNAEFNAPLGEGATLYEAKLVRSEDNAATGGIVVTLADDVKAEDDVVELTITEDDYDLDDGDVIVIGFPANTISLTKTKVGTEATVKVTGDFGTSDELVFCAVVDKAIDVEVDDTVDVAVEEIATLEDITIEPSVGEVIADVVTFDKNGEAELTLKLSKGFEFVGNTITINDVELDSNDGVEVDDNELTVLLSKNGIVNAAKWVISGLQIEATSAKEGDVATLSVSIDDVDTVKVEVATVCEYKVVMSVDEDEDVPVFYNGVDSDNTGLTVDDDHEALLVTIEETFTGAWSNHKDFTLTLPEGVHVVDVVDVAGTLSCDEATLLADAYKEGDHEYFEVEKRSFEETDEDSADENSIEFALVLTADPDFVGDVVLTLEGDAVDTQEVTIAKFVSPYTVKAEQNDLKIDYRYTAVDTEIVVTEAEAGLWAEGLTVTFAVDKDYIEFEDDVTVSVNEESGMEVDEAGKNDMGFKVKEESDEEPAVITFSGIELFMQRNIPAGPYDLEVATNDATAAFEAEELFAPDCGDKDNQDTDLTCKKDDHECWVADVCDYSEVVKEAWINVVTAGREQDDASFTTKVVVPVGESYIVAGETQIALDVPAYVNAAGYTMLPVRAVAVALGINTQNVLWDQATKTVTILYGQRIITMQVGAKVVYVNGSAIPASASVEIVDGRTFLPMRDLATALGVTDITWDAATKTATLNGNA